MNNYYVNTNNIIVQIQEITIEETIAECGGASIFTLDSNRKTLTSNEENGTSTSHDTLTSNEESRIYITLNVEFK